MKYSHIRMAYGWNKGLSRQINEDSVLCIGFDVNTHSGTLCAGLFAVADGMGGHNAGEIASDIAVRCLASTCVPNLISSQHYNPLSTLAAAYSEANSTILKSAEADEMKGMGTTLTSALIIGSDMYLGHIGDSRCYIINNREMLQVTKDHSTVQQLLDDGMISAEQAWNHPHKNEITRVIGLDEIIMPDFHHIKLYNGDTVMLCSDGLSGIVPSNIIAATILRLNNLQEACDTLINAANGNGGPDNISIILIQPDDLPSWQAVVESHTCVRIQ